MATVTASGILVLIALLQLKHAICDGPLQTGRMVHEKGHYGQSGGIVHASIHGAGSLLVLLVFGVPAMAAAALALAESVLHYHIDFVKESMGRRNGWTIEKPVFWWALMGDQLMHQLTYLLIAFAVIRMAS
jgi:hypothetical protein